MDWKLLKKLKIPRRQYLRPLPPSRREKLIGYAILVIVAGIGTLIYISSRHYDPNLFRLDPKLLNKSSKDPGEAAKPGEASKIAVEEKRPESEPVKTAEKPAAPYSTAPT